MVRSVAHGSLVRAFGLLVGALLMVAVAATPVRAEDPSGPASINIRTVTTNGERLAGAVYVISGVTGTFTSDADGKACVIGFPHDSIWEVTQVAAPDGFELADPATQMVEVDDDGDCNSPDALFTNAATQSPAPTPPSAVGPGQSASPTSRIPPRDDTLGGNPGPSVGSPPINFLPDTATTSGIPMVLVALLGVLTVGSAGVLGRALARNRRTR